MIESRVHSQDELKKYLFQKEDYDNISILLQDKGLNFFRNNDKKYTKDIGIQTAMPCLKCSETHKTNVEISDNLNNINIKNNGFIKSNKKLNNDYIKIINDLDRIKYFY